MNSTKQKSKPISYLLWFLLGGFGAHRFYLRRKRTAFILLGYSLITMVIDFVAIEYFPHVNFFSDETFYWLTTIPLWIFLLTDVFRISSWLEEINREDKGPSVFD